MATLITAGVGGVLSLVAVVLLIRTRGFLARAHAVKGTVIEMVYSRSSEGGGGYSPRYQFVTTDGQVIVRKDNLSTNPPRFQVGDEIDVLYEPAKPQKARINKWMNLYFLPTLLGGLGAVSALVAGVLAVVSR